jgi:hypothetical protein
MAPHYSAGTKDAMIKRTETFLLRQSLQSNIIIALAMERKFQLNQPSQNQPSQTLEHSRLGQECVAATDATRFWQCREQARAFAEP